MRIEDIDRELKEIEETIAPLNKRAADLAAQKRRLAGKAWIEVNEVRREDVQLSRGEGIPRFGDVYTFGKWLAKNSTKRFYEWNECIGFSHELINGVFRQSPAYLDDLS